MSKETFTYFIYSRCSTEEQNREGYSHDYQINGIKYNPAMRNGTCKAIFSDTYTGTSFERPEMMKMLQRIKRNNNVVDKIVIWAWDRFGRNLEHSLKTINVIRNAGVDIMCVSNKIDFDNPEEFFMYTIMGGMAEVESMKISQRTKDGINEALRAGHYPFSLPKGYIRKNKKILIDRIKGPIISDCFKKVYAGVPISELYQQYSKKLSISRSEFYRIFTRKIYTGHYDVPEYKSMPAVEVRGNMPALVSMDIFKAIKSKKSTYQSSARSIINSPFFLKGFLYCAISELYMTGYKSKGKSGKWYSYYQAPKIKGNILNAEKVMSAIDHVIMQINLLFGDDEISILKEVYNEEIAHYKNECKQLKEEAQKIAYLLNKVEKEYLEEIIPGQNYIELTTQLKNKLFSKQENIKELESFLSDPEIKTENMFEHLKNLSNIYQGCNKDGKLEILRCIFPEGIYMHKSDYQVRTPFINETILELSATTGFSDCVLNKNGTPFTQNPVEGERRDSIRTLSLILSRLAS